MLGVGVETVNPQVAMEGRVFPRVPDPSLRGAPRPSPPSSPESLPPRPNASFLWDPRRPPAAEDSFDAASFLRQHRHLLGRASPASPPTPLTPGTPTDDLTFEETLFSLRRRPRGVSRGESRVSVASSEDLWGPGSLKALKEDANLKAALAEGRCAPHRHHQGHHHHARRHHHHHHHRHHHGADSLDSRVSLASGASGAPGGALRGYIEARLRRVEEQIRREVATEAAVLGAARGGADPSLLAALLATRGYLTHGTGGSAPSLGGVSPSAASTFKSHRDPTRRRARRSPAVRSSASSLLRARGVSPSSSSDREGLPSLPPMRSRDLSPYAPASPKSLPPPPPPVLDLPPPPRHHHESSRPPTPQEKALSPLPPPPPEALEGPQDLPSPTPPHSSHPPSVCLPHIPSAPLPQLTPAPLPQQPPVLPQEASASLPQSPPDPLPQGTTESLQREDKTPLRVPPPRPPAPAPPARPPRPPRPPRPAVAKPGEKKPSEDGTPGPPQVPKRPPRPDPPRSTPAALQTTPPGQDGGAHGGGTTTTEEKEESPGQDPRTTPATRGSEDPPAPHSPGGASTTPGDRSQTEETVTDHTTRTG